jgi:hypothetical protein
MSKTRWLAVFVLPLLLVSFLQSQSLAELAKKEKERRAALKGKPATVITTADLAKVKKRPAVETTTQEQATEEVAVEEVAATPAAGQEAGAAEAAAGEAAPPPAKPIETLPDLQNAPPAAKDIQARIAELTKAANEKQELVELLNLKMNSLYQEFYNLESVKSRETLQLQISDTYDKLLKAQLDATKAVKELDDYVAQAQKDKAPVIWIK